MEKLDMLQEAILSPLPSPSISPLPHHAHTATWSPGPESSLGFSEEGSAVGWVCMLGNMVVKAGGIQPRGKVHKI